MSLEKGLRTTYFPLPPTLPGDTYAVGGKGGYALRTTGLEQHGDPQNTLTTTQNLLVPLNVLIAIFLEALEKVVSLCFLT